MTQLIINKLTKAQYENIIPDENQLYLITDDADSGEVIPAVDDKTIFIEADKLTAKGIKTSNGQILTTWVGTKAEYDAAYAAGEIPENMLCVITDQ